MEIIVETGEEGISRNRMDKKASEFSSPHTTSEILIDLANDGAITYPRREEWRRGTRRVAYPTDEGKKLHEMHRGARDIQEAKTEIVNLGVYPLYEKSQAGEPFGLRLYGLHPTLHADKAALHWERAGLLDDPERRSDEFRNHPLVKWIFEGGLWRHKYAKIGIYKKLRGRGRLADWFVDAPNDMPFTLMIKYEPLPSGSKSSK